MKSRPTKAKRTLADFIRGNPVDNSEDFAELSLDFAELSLDEPAAVPSQPTQSETKKPAKKKKSPPKSTKPTKTGLAPKEPPSQAPSPTPAGDEQLPTLANPAPAFLDAIADLADFRNCLDRWVKQETFYWDGAWLGAVGPLACSAQRILKRPLLILVAHHQDAETLAR
ncbi:MAG: hypothetical protein ACK480_15765, partial [Planctomycetota bacterium]